MNALRLALGTLSILPTPAPSRVDRRVAGTAMVLAPLVALVLAVPLWGLAELTESQWSPFLRACVWVGGLALLTRAIHLDGLADTADGLGSRKPAPEALDIMRRSDVGPFGVATLVLVLLVQVAAATELLALDDGPLYVAAALVISRLVVPATCLGVVPAARLDGLGSVVAGSVSWLLMVVCIAATTAGVLALSVAGDLEVDRLLLGFAGPAFGALFLWWCVRRLGGVTGDVIGACVEVAFTATLLALLL